MATTITKVIGTGGDYTTIADWIAAIPANLVTADEIWRGELKNETFTHTTEVTISGKTTDATRYIELTTQAGASFADNANVQTNALRANASNGALITSAQTSLFALRCSVNYTRFTKLQIENAAGSTGGNGLYLDDARGSRVDRCIIEATGAPGYYSSDSGGSLPIIVSNTLHVQRGASRPQIVTVFGDFTGVNCTFACPSDITAPTVCFDWSFANPTLTNCAVFGAAAVQDEVPGAFTYTNCRTNVAGLPDGFTQLAYDTSTGAGFENITDATRDFRIKSTSAMKDAGTTSATYGTPSINGLARPQGAAYDIGAWELVQAVASACVVALQ